MINLIEWLQSVENLASDVYAEAAERFKADKPFTQFLKSLSEDEAWHYHLMGSAAGTVASSEDLPPLEIKIGEDTIERVEIPLKACLNKIRSHTIEKQDIIRCIVDTEFTEWNDIFIYVISMLQERSRAFQRIASTIQAHEEKIENFLDNLPASLLPQGYVQSLPKIWDHKYLLVDDDEPVRNIFHAFLSRGADVVTAENGKEALEKIRKSFFDIVISDIHMPVMDGLELFQLAGEFDPEIKRRFVFFSGNVTSEVYALCSQNELPILEKPFKLSDLKSVIDQQIFVASAEPVVKLDIQKNF